ncbi:STAS domain-containing protein [Streptomyces sp. NPDC101169]|uniref:STAS domain-containing protein n=1 Tax=Streptomyces sp. NPDC101169 TaxID=3366121 RepID=UPI00381E2C98
MNITTTIDGTFARIRLRGEIDFDTLPPLRAAVDALPPQVTDVQWDLIHTPFMDVAGLHLLFTPVADDAPRRRATVTGLRAQPLSLLLAAADVNPTVFDFCRLLPDVAPADLRPSTP